MAIGIDRRVHKTLLEELEKLTLDCETSEWSLMLTELRESYLKVMESLHLVENTVEKYNRMQGIVRTKVSMEIRGRKRQNKNKLN